MRSVLIVDDEKFISMGMKALIERSDTDFKEIYNASSGDEALALIESRQFDLIITDIRMPKMDGLTFVKLLREKSIDSKIIILSGYSEFSYAQEALKLGVKRYMLKPIKMEELLDSLNQIQAELDDEDELKNMPDYNAPELDRYAMNQLSYIFIKGNVTESEAMDILKVTCPIIFETQYKIAMLIEHGEYTESGNSETILRTYVNDYFSSIGKKVAVFEDASNNVGLVIDNDTDILGLVEYLKRNHGSKYSIGISEVFDDPISIYNAYEHALEALKYTLLTVSSRAIRYENIKDLTKDSLVPIDEIKRISQIVGTKRLDEIDSLLNTILNIEVLRVNSIGYLEEIVYNINKYIISYFMNEIPQKKQYYTEQYGYITNIYNFSDIKDYVHALRTYIIEINNYFLTIKDIYKEKNEIDTAIEYVKDNYYKDLNMAVVANYVGLNYFYFSQFFKDNTGMNFVEFLKKVRIEKAQELLRTSNTKVFEIAQSVGYQNAKHFAKDFRMVTGISPTEFREKNTKGAEE